MSKVLWTYGLAEAGVNKKKIRHSLRRKEEVIKGNQRREAANRYHGYYLVDEKPVYECSVEIVPEKREPVYKTVDRKGYQESPYVPGYYHTYYYTQNVKVGEMVTPEQKIRRRRFVGYEAVEKPYVKAIDRASKKRLKKASNKKLRHSRFREVSQFGSSYKRLSEQIA